MTFKQPAKNIFIRDNHVEPLRFYANIDGASVALIDLQIKEELRNLDDPVKQEHSLSIYLKPPVNSHYLVHSKEYTVTKIKDNVLQFHLKKLTDDEKLYNPYISWHGSGQVHAKAHSFKGGSYRPQILVENKTAISWRDVRMAYSLVLRAIVTVNSETKDTLDLKVESTMNLTKQTLPKGKIQNIILNTNDMTSDTVVIDVFVHNRGYSFRETGQLPYAKDGELIWLAPPITFLNDASPFLPGVSIFAYQPTEDGKKDGETIPLILNGITTDHPINDIYIQAKYTDLDPLETLSKQ